MGDMFSRIFIVKTHFEFLLKFVNSKNEKNLTNKHEMCYYKLKLR